MGKERERERKRERELSGKFYGPGLVSVLHPFHPHAIGQELVT